LTICFVVTVDGSRQSKPESEETEESKAKADKQEVDN
jgi:hypothetical protein